MAEREKWSQPITCTRCGAEGNVTFSDDPNVVMTGETLAVDNVAGDFQLERLGQTAGGTTFRCLKCGTVTAGGARPL